MLPFWVANAFPVVAACPAFRGGFTSIRGLGTKINGLSLVGSSNRENLAPRITIAGEKNALCY